MEEKTIIARVRRPSALRSRMAASHARAAWVLGMIGCVVTASAPPPLRFLSVVEEHADPQPHSRHLSNDLCGGVGQTCSTSNARASCASIGSTPGFCDFSSFVDYSGASYNTGLGIPSYPYFNGTCAALNSNYYVGNVYGKPCSSTFECNSFAPFMRNHPLACVPDDSGGPSTCAFANPSIGDPCVRNSDCYVAPTSSSLGPTSMRCDLSTHMCAYNATLLGFNESCRNSYGTTTGTCAPGLYCDSRYAWPAPPLYTCQYVGAVGELCASFVGGRSCASGLVCVPANSTAGTCAPYNSLPNGAAFYIPYLSSILSVTNGRDYCISGLAVPVANTSTGYPAPYGRCVAVLDLTHAGEPCDQCAWVSIPGSSWYFNDKLIALLPVYGDGSLVCAPTTMNSSLHPCVLLPSSITPMEFLSTYMPYAQCYHASTGPAGTPCNLNGNGACSLFACFGTLMSFYSSLLSGGINNYLDRFWARYSPDIQSPSSSCTGSDIDTLIAYAGQMDYTAACGLPPAFAAVGWTCPQASHSPGPSMASPSAPPTFGQSTSRTPTPSMTPLPGLAVVQVQFTITFSGAGPSLNASAFTSPSTAYMLRLGIACFAHIPVANVTIAAVVVSVDGVSKVATPLSPTSLSNIATGQTCVSLAASVRLLGLQISVADDPADRDSLESHPQLRSLSSAPFVGAVMGAAVAVPIPPGQPAPSDPAAAPQVQSVLTSLSPLLGSGSSTQSSSSFASAATQATGSFLSAVGTNSSAVAVTASAPAVTYASLPPGTTVAGPKQSAANGSPVNIGVAVGAAVGCVVAVGLIAAVVWLLLLRKRGSSSGPAHELAKKQQTSVLAGAQDGQSEGFVNPMANHPR